MKNGIHQALSAQNAPLELCFHHQTRLREEWVSPTYITVILTYIIIKNLQQ